ncbi:hypothetical protein GMMP15_1340007 [Candidatus Magnetomoraceae bacterium gMMP-15]
MFAIPKEIINTEIHDAVESDNAENLLELVFVPLYGREHGRERFAT